MTANESRLLKENKALRKEIQELRSRVKILEYLDQMSRKKEEELTKVLRDGHRR